MDRGDAHQACQTGSTACVCVCVCGGGVSICNKNMELALFRI